MRAAGVARAAGWRGGADAVVVVEAGGDCGRDGGGEVGADGGADTGAAERGAGAGRGAGALAPRRRLTGPAGEVGPAGEAGGGTGVRGRCRRD
ncbi:MAG TPA: hypothetical protein VKZ67_03060 [Natronosporangium sp.]|nr:hypothetical protein [Natronosporangium sp.]